MLRALIWDIDGTVAETERDGHRIAFNEAFEAHGVAWRWDVPTYGRLVAVAGGGERLLHDMASRPDAPHDADERVALARRIHATKNARYAAIVASGRLAFRPGVLRVMEACEAAGIALAIATTTSRGNVDALFHARLGKSWAARFDAIVCAEDAPAKKPDPLVYRIALERLGIEAGEAIAIEDSPNGVAAAVAAGVTTLVTRSDYFATASFTFANAWCDDLDSTVTWSDGRALQVDVEALRAILTSSRPPRALSNDRVTKEMDP